MLAISCPSGIVQKTRGSASVGHALSEAMPTTNSMQAPTGSVARQWRNSAKSPAHPLMSRPHSKLARPCMSKRVVQNKSSMEVDFNVIPAVVEYHVSVPSIVEEISQCPREE